MPFALLFSFLVGMYLGIRYKVLVLVPATFVTAAMAYLYACRLDYSSAMTILLFFGLTAVMQSGYIVAVGAVSPASSKQTQQLRRA